MSAGSNVTVRTNDGRGFVSRPCRSTAPLWIRQRTAYSMRVFPVRGTLGPCPFRC